MIRVQYMPENATKDTNPAGTIYGADVEHVLHSLPAQTTLNYWRSAAFLREAKHDYESQGLYEGRSLDFQTARASRPRFAPTPFFEPLPAELFDETPANVHVTARVFDGDLPAERK